MSDERLRKLRAASNPRRARRDDVRALTELFAIAFLEDPVLDWTMRSGPKRRAALEEFFFRVFDKRAIPAGEVWMAEDGATAAALPPDVTKQPDGFIQQLKLLPLYLRCCGFAKLAHGAAIAKTMEANHP
ncbi:MAG: hypothetical protein ACXU9C_15160 [Xanthobacteraceae bacterium]